MIDAIVLAAVFVLGLGCGWLLASKRQGLGFRAGLAIGRWWGELPWRE